MHNIYFIYISETLFNKNSGMKIILFYTIDNKSTYEPLRESKANKN